MSDKTRKKKDGENQNKAAQRMHEAEKISHENPGDRSAYVKEQEGRDQTALEQLDRDDFDKDLRPNEFAGENSGADTAQNEKNAPSAYQHKELHDRFPQLSSADLKNIPILPAGTRLDQGRDLPRLEQPGKGRILRRFQRNRRRERSHRAQNRGRLSAVEPPDRKRGRQRVILKRPQRTARGKGHPVFVECRGGAAL